MLHAGSACRNKVLNTLRKKFKTPEQAEAHYFPKKLVSSDPTPGGQELQVTPIVATPSGFTLLTPNQQLQAVSDLFGSSAPLTQVSSSQMIS